MSNWKTAFGSYLKSDDLEGREVRAVIESIDNETIKGDRGEESKLVAHFAGKEKGLILNRTNAESIAAIAGDDDTENWTGTCVILFVDPNVTFGGKKVPAIRVKAPRTAPTATAPGSTRRATAKQPEPPPVDDAPEITGDDIPF